MHVHYEDAVRQRQQAIIDGGLDAFYILGAIRDDQRTIVDFVYVELNLRAAERLKRPREEVLGKRMTDLFSLEQMKSFIATYARVIETREPHEEERPLSIQGINTTWIRHHIVPLGDAVAVSSRDISHRKQEEAALRASEEALRKSHELLEQRVADRTAELSATNVELTRQIAQRQKAEDRFTRLFESGLLAISIADAKGRVFEVNNAFTKLVGYTRDELLAPGFDGLKVIPPEWQDVSRASQRDLMTRGVSEPHEREFFRKDGSRVPVLLGAAMLGTTELVVCATDLTETKKAQTALRHAEDQLRQSQKIEAIGSLAGGIAHDFNNLLSVILSYGEMIESGLNEGDPMRVMMNLVVNSRDAMPMGGKLTIETSNVQLSPEYAREHPEVTPGPHVMIAVSDNGTGMDAETCARVFDPFFTTKGPGKGTGLGLSTVFGIVKQSGGHVWVYSEPGVGTTFKVYFPRIEGPDAEVETTVSGESVSLRGAETILLVEDEERVRTLARTVLKRHGYHVLEAQSGGDALLICEQHPARIDLLLTDVVMPRMTGRQLADRLRTVRPDMKVLYMSGYTDNSIVHHGVLDSGINFLEKPLTVESLTRKIRAVLDSRND